MACLLGFDIGSSSIKASLLEVESGRVLASATSPDVEMEIQAPRPGWAEQDPRIWWEHVKLATAKMRSAVGRRLTDTMAIGISYQMHGLVVVDQDRRVLRPAIIWCDSRAVEIGSRAFRDLGQEKCLGHLLNSPGNFTASKLRWVRENEPQIYGRVHKAMLPGEWVAMMMTGRITTTPSGLSEGILWDFQAGSVAQMLLDYYDISPDLLPEVVPVFSSQGGLTGEAAAELGLREGTPVTYRAGDQPNNAFSLGVLDAGEVAATAGTSGVVYGVVSAANYDRTSRVNAFVHVNHAANAPRYGILLCVNGTAILNRWLRSQIMGGEASYDQMNELASRVPVGAEGVTVLPYGNGAERTLANRAPGASIHGLNFNTHGRAHILRAAQEGIVFALRYGVGIMGEMGLKPRIVKAGFTNMFMSPLFCEAFATATGAPVELFDTDGSQGAARGAGVGAGAYRGCEDAFDGLRAIKVIEPNPSLVTAYGESYQRWLDALEHQLKSGRKVVRD